MAADQAPLSTGFSRQEYWSGLPFPSPNYSVRKLYFNLKKGKKSYSRTESTVFGGGVLIYFEKLSISAFFKASFILILFLTNQTLPLECGQTLTHN